MGCTFFRINLGIIHAAFLVFIAQSNAVRRKTPVQLVFEHRKMSETLLAKIIMRVADCPSLESNEDA